MFLYSNESIEIMLAVIYTWLQKLIENVGNVIVNISMYKLDGHSHVLNDVKLSSIKICFICSDNVFKYFITTWGF